MSEICVSICGIANNGNSNSGTYFIVFKKKECMCKGVQWAYEDGALCTIESPDKGQLTVVNIILSCNRV